MFYRIDIDSGDSILMTDPKGCLFLECEAAKKEFYKFVQLVYNGLYKIESRVNGGKSPLSVFCRFNIGLIENSDQKVKWPLILLHRSI